MRGIIITKAASKGSLPALVWLLYSLCCSYQDGNIHLKALFSATPSLRAPPVPGLPRDPGFSHR